MAHENIFQEFVEKITTMPLWIKEVMYLNLKANLENSITKSHLETIDEKDIFQLYVPKITFRGEKELASREKGLNPNFYRFLENCLTQKQIIEITINNFWTLEECANYFTDAIDLEYINKTESKIILSTAFYSSGKIRLGEYFVRIGKINLDQLDQALRTQKQNAENGENKMGIGDIMISLGFLTEQDIQAILLIKEESKKRFILNLSIDTYQSNIKNSDGDDDLVCLKKQLAKSLNENKIFKDQLRKILNIEKRI